MQIKRFKQSQKFRVIVDNASFYATAKQIRNGVGGLALCNAATQKALDALEFTRSGKGAAESAVSWLCITESAACGIAGIWEGLTVQLDVV